MAQEILFLFSLSQLDSNNTLISTTTPVNLSAVGLATINFTLNSGAAYFRINLSIAGGGEVTITDFKLNLHETAAIQAEIAQSLKLSSSFNEENFKGELGDTSYYKKVTLSLSNSNLYNAFIELSKLFNAVVVFYYETNEINFVSKDYDYSYKGLRFAPDFNLSSLSRNEEFNEFVTAMSVTGNESVNSILPAIPSEFKQYLQECINNNFSGDANFANYAAGGYQNVADTYIKVNNDYISSSDNREERIKLIDNFAKAADKVPNFENTLYSLDYYNDTGKITPAQYSAFNNIVNNDLRKVNIKLRLYSERYSNAYSILSSIEYQIDFYTQNLVVENLNIQNIDEELALVDQFSPEWVGLINSKKSSLEAIDDYTIKLLDLYNFVYTTDNTHPITGMINSGGTNFTSAGHGLSVGDRLVVEYFDINYNLPVGLALETYYYVVSADTNTFKIRDLDGAPILTLDAAELSNINGWHFVSLPHILGIALENSTTELLNQSYTRLVLNIYGYYNIYKNGIQEKIDEVKTTITELANKKLEQENRIAVLDQILSDFPNVENPRNIEATVEKKGLLAQIDASVFNIGQYSDVWNPDLKGKYHYQLEYLQAIKGYLDSYGYKSTLIDYSLWTVGSPQIPGTPPYTWDYTGTVNTSLQNNKDNVEDIMMSMTTTGAVLANLIPLTAGNSYRSSGLFKVPSGAFGTFTVQLRIPASTIIGTISFNLTSVAYTRWIGFEFNSSSTGSAVYLMPAKTPITLTTSTYAAIPSTTNYTLTYSFSGTGTVYLYRPRMELISSTMPTIDDIYFLYDNPLMNGFDPDNLLNFSLIEGLYDLLYNESYPNNVNIAKQQIINSLYRNYEQYLIEGYYENSDELTSEGLLEQALINFEINQYPQIKYNLSVIDLSALENYKFLNINIGDKIAIVDPLNRLYKNYQGADYLDIREISYNLRQPEGTSLTVSQDDETKKIIQYILKGVY